MKPDKPLGIALYCRENGVVEEIIVDDFGIISGRNGGVGKLFQNMIDEASRQKAFEFLVEVKSNRIAFDYQMNLPVDGVVKTLYFIGVLVTEKILVVGANNHKDVVDFTNRMQEISNEQANLIRSLIKVQHMPQQQNEDPGLYDEISKLNNELVNLQRELTLKNFELLKLNELKNKFLGMAAHDLRNPISAIMGFSDILSGDLKGSLSANQTRMLSIIRDSSGFMLRLLEDLLDITAIESGKLNLELQPVDLRQLIEKNAELNSLAGARKNISLRVEAEGDIPLISIDSSKIEQVMNNLITNAIKFSFPGAAVKIGITAEGNEVTVSVADQGPGIPAGELHKLFIPFERTSVKSTAGEKSTGLGLSIARNIVAGHGGRIWAESLEGAGSIFSFTLPIIRTK
jgi:signal transduction histidine kinase